MIINIFSYWIVGFPMAYAAAKIFNLSPSYIWAAFVIALTASALLLSLRLYYMGSKAIKDHELATQPS